jgi:hypothetical protein
MSSVGYINSFVSNAVVAFGCVSEDAVESPKAMPALQEPRNFVKAVDVSLEELKRVGSAETPDGKAWVILAEKALSDPRIDHSRIDSRIKAVKSGKSVALTINGLRGTEGQFRVDDKAPGVWTPAALIIVSSRELNSGILIRDILSHELQHARGYISGESGQILNALKDIVNAAQGSEEEKQRILTSYFGMIIETRALLGQLEYFFYTDYKMSSTARKNVFRETVDKIDVCFGYKNYVHEKTKMLELKDSKYGYTFLQLLDSFFWKAVPIKVIVEYNKKLKPHNIMINSVHRNSDAKNEKITKDFNPTTH